MGRQHDQPGRTLIRSGFSCPVIFACGRLLLPSGHQQLGVGGFLALSV
jgi:hypothetical protein